MDDLGPGQAAELGRRVQGGVGGEHLLVQSPQLRAWIDAELPGQHVAGIRERSQCVGWPAAAVQRQHHLGPEPFSQRMLADQRGQLGQCLMVAAQCEQDVDAFLGRGLPQLIQPGPLDVGPRAGDPGQRGTLP